MGASKLSEISETLLQDNISPETPVALIHNTGNVSEKAVFTTVSEMVKENIDSPAIIIIGNVAELLNQPEKILYTGLAPDYSKFKERIIHYPLIKVSPVKTPELNLQEYDAIMFTSKSAVNFFFSQSILPLKKWGKEREMSTFNCSPPFLNGVRGISSPPFLNGVRGIFSIGNETAKEINKSGCQVDYIAEKPDSDSLAELVKQTNFKKILYPCSDISENALHTLENVHPKVFYKTEFIEQPEIDLTDFTGIVFSSPSTVSSFINIYKTIPKHLICYVFGKHTQKKLENNNVNIINLNT